MKKILMIIASGALLTGMLSCSSDPMACEDELATGGTALAPSDTRSPVGHIFPCQTPPSPEYIDCGEDGGTYTITRCHPVRLTYGHPGWIVPENKSDFPIGGGDRNESKMAWTFNIGYNNWGGTRYAEIEFSDLGPDDGFGYGWEKSRVLVRQKGSYDLPSPISTTKQYYHYGLDARDVELILDAENAVSDLKAYWTISWIRHLTTEKLGYENGKQRFKMRFHLNEYPSRTTSAGVSANDRLPMGSFPIQYDTLSVPGYRIPTRDGAIRLQYTINGEIRYFDISVSQSKIYI